MRRLFQGTRHIIIRSENIVAGGVLTEHIADLAITSGKIASGSVKTGKIATGAIINHHFSIGFTRTASGSATYTCTDVGIVRLKTVGGAGDTSYIQQYVGGAWTNVGSGGPSGVPVVATVWSTGTDTRVLCSGSCSWTIDALD